MKRMYYSIFIVILIVPVYVASQELPTMPPSGYFDNQGNPAGEVENITYGADYPARVYTPPDYSESKTYACMYLMHGMGGSERSWHDNDLYAHIQLDNLIAEEKVAPFIIVFTKNDMNNWSFEGPLLNDLIPYMEEHYSVSANPDNRALGGLSMGGMQTLNIGLANLDVFHYLMPSSSAPGVKSNNELFPNSGAEAGEKLKLLLLTCGSADGLISNNNRVMDYCEGNDIPNVYEWIVEGAGHDRNTWRPSFWDFARMAHDRGFTNVEGTVVREYHDHNFTIVTNAEKVHVFDLRGKSLKSIMNPESIKRASSIAPGLYIIRRQNGNHNRADRYSVGCEYGRRETR